MGISNNHFMIPGSDYEEETLFASTIRSPFIEEERRQICYNQVVYDDERLELTEVAGLDLVLDDLDTLVEVEPFYDDSVFFIIDDDGIVVMVAILRHVCMYICSKMIIYLSGNM